MDPSPTHHTRSASPDAASPAAVVPSWIALLACLLLAAIAYGPTALRASFLNFDDNLFFGPDNPLFRAASQAADQHGLWQGLLVVLDPRQVVADVYLPVSTGSLFVDHWLFDGPVGPHVMALLLHALAGFALFRWLSAMRVSSWLAMGAVAVFVLHPALAESVAWVSSRKDILCGLFVFAAMAQVARLGTGADRTSLRLLLVAALGTLAMYSKATAVVQPLLATLVCLYVGGARRRWWGPVVLAAVTLPIAWHHQLLAQQAGTMVSGSLIERLPQAPGAFWHYLQVAFWPRGLNVLYPEVKTLEAFAASWWLGAIALGAVLAGAVVAWRRPRLRTIGLGLLGFVVALLPFNTAFPASVIAAADRYLYLAMPFFALALVAAAARVVRRPLVAGAVLASVCLIAVLQRAPAFAGSEALWRSSLSVDGENAVALLNLVHALQVAGTGSADEAAQIRATVDRAIAVARYPEHELRARLLRCDLALQDNMCQLAAEHAAGAIAAAQRIGETGRVAAAVATRQLVQTSLVAITPFRLGGRLADAQAALQRAQALAPDDPGVVAAGVVLEVDAMAGEWQAQRAAGRSAPQDPARLAAIEARIDRARRSVDALQREQLAQRGDAAAATREAPYRDAQLEAAAGMFERLRGNPLQALACYRRAIDAAPLLVEGWLGAAQVCLDVPMYDKAEEYASSGLVATTSVGVRDPRLLHARAQALAGMGRLPEAVSALKAYARVQPRDRDAARLLSSLLMAQAIARLSDPEVVHGELQHLIDDALAYNPQEPRVDLVRARMLRDRGDFAAAVAALDRAIAALPEFTDAKEMLADNLRDLGYQRLWQDKDDEGAAAAWLRLRELAPGHVSSEAIGMQLQAIWRRAEERGVAALRTGDRAAAEQAFRACLRVEPDHHWAAYLLAMTLVDAPEVDLQELDALSARALAGQQASGLERSKQVLVRALALRRLGRAPEARGLIEDYLRAPDAEPHQASMVALATLRDELAK